MIPLSDTSPEAEQVLVNVFRQMSIARRWLLMGETYRNGRMLPATGIRWRNLSATRRDILEDWLRTQFRCDAMRSARANSRSAPRRG